MAKKPEPVKRTLIHPDNCELCDGSGFVPETWIRHGKYTEGVKRCPNFKVEVTQ